MQYLLLLMQNTCRQPSLSEEVGYTLMFGNWTERQALRQEGRRWPWCI